MGGDEERKQKRGRERKIGRRERKIGRGERKRD